MALSPNGKTIASGSSDGKVRLWDVETRKVIAKWTGHTSRVRSVYWSADGERVVSGSLDRAVRVWDVKSGKIVLDLFETGHQLVYAVIYSPDTTKIATGGFNENAIKIWDANTGELLSTIKHKHPVWSLAWTSDQKKLISGSYRLIRIFDTATWQELTFLKGHTSNVNALSLFQNDRLLASASDDNTARLWNLDPNLPVGPSLLHRKRVYSTAIFADGKRLATSCEDKNAYIWDIETILKDAGLEHLLSIPYTSKESVDLSNSLQDLTNQLQGRPNHPITSGGFGDIWKCELFKLNETVQVAVKTIRAFESDNDVLMRKNSRRVRRELNVWGRLKHDCILPLWGVASNFGPYPAMICPWVKNGALTGFLEREQDTLSSHDKFSLLNDIVVGLQYLHDKSIVHGDLTGSNVLVHGNGRACLADFGLSTIVMEFMGTSYFTNTIRGNIRWAAKELFEVPEDDDDDQAAISLSIECDIYSFGSIALQVLTCKVPYYNVKKDIVVVGQVLSGKKPELPKGSHIAPSCWEFIQRCWLPRADRPLVGEIVAFIAREQQALVS